MRLMIGAAAAAALALIGSGLIRVPVTGDEVLAQASAPTSRPPRAKKVKRPIRYVRLKPGQKAPRGARVIREAAPTPRVIVRLVAPASRATTRAVSTQRVITRTRQSGG
jgi:hypothetical protein